MAHESISQWAVIAHACKSTIILESVSPEYFHGLASLVYRELKSLKEPSESMLLERIREVYPIDYPVVLEMLEEGEKVDDIDSHIQAIKFSFNDRKIKDIIVQGHLDIESGKNRSMVAEDIITRLSTISGGSIEEFDDIDKMVAEHDTISTGLTGLFPEFIDYELGNIMALGGDTGTFKTTTAVFYANKALIANPDPNFHVMYFSKEQPVREIWHKMIACHFGYSYPEVQQKFNINHPTYLLNAKKAVKESSVLTRFHVIDQRFFFNITDIISYIRSYRKHKIMWIIDYLTCLSFDNKGGNMSADMGEQLHRLKSATISTNSFGIILNQFKDSWNVSKDGLVKRFPTRGDIIWSSEMKNLASYILLLYRPSTYFDEYPKHILFSNFAKVRHQDLDAKVPLVADGHIQSFKPIQSGADIATVAKILTDFKRKFFK
jgi:hypothetical protein